LAIRKCYHGIYFTCEKKERLNPDQRPKNLVIFYTVLLFECEGEVASWFKVRSSPERAVWVRALAEDIVGFQGKSRYSHSASLHLGV